MVQAKPLCQGPGVQEKIQHPLWIESQSVESVPLMNVEKKSKKKKKGNFLFPTSWDRGPCLYYKSPSGCSLN